MEWLWLAQITANFLFLVFILFGWRELKTRGSGASMDEALTDLQRRVKEWEEDSQKSKARMEEHLSLLGSVGTRAQELLQRSQQHIQTRIPTLEEQELLGFSESSVPAPRAPAVASEPRTGLRDVLRETL